MTIMINNNAKSKLYFSFIFLLLVLVLLPEGFCEDCSGSSRWVAASGGTGFWRCQNGRIQFSSSHNGDNLVTFSHAQLVGPSSTVNLDEIPTSVFGSAQRPAPRAESQPPQQSPTVGPGGATRRDVSGEEDADAQQDDDGGNWGSAAAGAAAAFGASTAVGMGSSYLVNSLFGMDPVQSQNTAMIGGISGGVLSGVGSLFFGPLGAGLGGLLGTSMGYAIGAAMSQGELIKTIDRTVVFDTNYLRIQENSVVLNRPLFKARGDLATDANNSNAGMTPLGVVQSKFLYAGKFLKQDNGKTIAVYPVGFAKNGMKQLEQGVLFINYDRLDVNKVLANLANELPGDSGEIYWEDAKSDATVKAEHDDVVVNFLQNRAGDLTYRNAETISFSLLFRDINKEQMSFVLPNISCFRDDGVAGATGKDAVPKVSFSWKYEEVGTQKLCSNGKIYCDATQFTLEVIARLNSANTYLTNNSITTNNNAGQSYTLTPEIPDQYVPVTVNGTFGEKEFEMTIVNNENATQKIYYLVYIKNLEVNEETKSTEGSYEILPNTSYPLLLNNRPKTVQELNLAISRYQIKMVVEIGTDVNKKQYTLYSKVLDLYKKDVLTTSDEILKNDTATGRPQYNTLHFKANLMADGYTNDFLNDFKYYAQYQQFLGSVPKWSHDLMPDKLVFLPKAGTQSNPQGFRLSNAGTYNVDIVVKYKDANSSSEFDVIAGDNLAPNVEKVYVYLEPALIDYNPLYYLPLNSTVGVVNGRIEREGYGVDFQEDPAGGFIKFNNAVDELLIISPTLTSNSNPLAHLELRRIEGSMETFNNSRRGILLQVTNAGLSGGTITRRIEFMPNIPYPVAMALQKKTDGPAWGVYTLFSQNGPVNSGNRLIIWKQFCNSMSDFENYACEFFDGSAPIDHQADSDTVGAKMKAPTGQLAANSYGIEVDKDSILRDGKHSTVAMRGIVYAPANYKLSIAPISASDVMKLYSSADVSSEDFVKLISGTALTKGASVDLVASNITAPETVQSVYDLVANNWVCVSGSKNNTSVQFWWNPAMVFCNGDSTCEGRLSTNTD